MKELSPKKKHREELIQELTGRADEGPALQILVIARGLAEEEDARLAAAAAGDGLARASVERAGDAGTDPGGDQVEARQRSVLHRR